MIHGRTVNQWLVTDAEWFMHWFLIVLACGGARVVQWTPPGYEFQPASELGLYDYKATTGP